MDKNKLVIAVLIVVVLALAAGVFLSLPGHAKQDTQVIITCNSTLHEGDEVYVKLMDLNKTPIENQTVNVTITDNDNVDSSYSVLTNAKGVGKLKLDKVVGNYSINCTYAGNEKYDGNSTVKDISIEKEVVEAQVESSSSNSDPGAFYSRQRGAMIYTGDVVDSPGGKMRHLGNNEWEPVDG